MIKTGLVSITFRHLNPEEIISLVAEAGLDGIEWGGDVHVPHGDTSTARDVAQKTREAGLNVSSYGSYYRLEENPDFSFEDVLETARALDTDLVRIWAGRKGSDEAEEDDWKETTEKAHICAQKAHEAGIRIATEWHGGTLTDTAEAAVRFFEMVDHRNLFTYWQPRTFQPPEKCLADMQAALPHLAGIHVFHWDTETRDRLPLKKGRRIWERYFQEARKAPVQSGDIYALLEFVQNDDPEQFPDDAAELRNAVRSAEGAPG